MEADLIKGRLSDDSDVRPEAFAASFQTSEGEHQHAFLFPNIQHSTFHQPQAGPPFSPERETFCIFLLISFSMLVFLKENIPLCSCNPIGLHGLENPSGFLPTYEPWLIPTCESYDSHRQQTKFAAFRCGSNQSLYFFESGWDTEVVFGCSITDWTVYRHTFRKDCTFKNEICAQTDRKNISIKLNKDI